MPQSRIEAFVEFCRIEIDSILQATLLKELSLLFFSFALFGPPACLQFHFNERIDVTGEKRKFISNASSMRPFCIVVHLKDFCYNIAEG